MFVWCWLVEVRWWVYWYGGPPLLHLFFFFKYSMTVINITWPVSDWCLVRHNWPTPISYYFFILEKKMAFLTLPKIRVIGKINGLAIWHFLVVRIDASSLGKFFSSLNLSLGQVWPKILLAITLPHELRFECHLHRWNQDDKQYDLVLVFLQSEDFYFWAFP